MRIIQSPGKYIQGPDALFSLDSYIKPLGKSWLLLVDPVMMPMLPRITDHGAGDIHFHVVLFNGECSHKEIKRISTEASTKNVRALLA